MDCEEVPGPLVLRHHMRVCEFSLVGLDLFAVTEEQTFGIGRSGTTQESRKTR